METAIGDLRQISVACAYCNVLLHRVTEPAALTPSYPTKTQNSGAGARRRGDCFTPTSRHSKRRCARQSRATTGLMQRSKAGRGEGKAGL
jgi:hypothetical protein